MRGKLLREIGALRDAEKALEEAIRINEENVYAKVLLIEVLRETVDRAARGNRAGIDSALRRGTQLCKEVLARDPTNRRATDAQVAFHHVRDDLEG